MKNAGGVMKRRPAGPRGGPAAAATANPYLAYAEFRVAKHRAKPVSETFRYFRQTADHSILWVVIMRGYYLGEPPTLKACILEARSSKETVRKIILDAQAKGYLTLRQATDDRRKKLVWPTRQCIAEFESMVDSYHRLIQGY